MPLDIYMPMRILLVFHIRVHVYMEDIMEGTDIRQAVRQKYGEIATTVRQSGGAACCGPTCCSTDDPITGNLYNKEETSGLPKDAVAASLGCGNPTALIDLHPGETV